jgi:hypothetical protein
VHLESFRTEAKELEPVFDEKRTLSMRNVVRLRELNDNIAALQLLLRLLFPGEGHVELPIHDRGPIRAEVDLDSRRPKRELPEEPAVPRQPIRSERDAARADSDLVRESIPRCVPQLRPLRTERQLARLASDEDLRVTHSEPDVHVTVTDKNPVNVRGDRDHRPPLSVQSKSRWSVMSTT